MKHAEHHRPNRFALAHFFHRARARDKSFTTTTMFCLTGWPCSTTHFTLWFQKRFLLTARDHPITIFLCSTCRLPCLSFDASMVVDASATLSRICMVQIGVWIQAEFFGLLTPGLRGRPSATRSYMLTTWPLILVLNRLACSYCLCNYIL
jgi:hypothetical protein